MNLKTIRSICISCFALLIIFYPLKTDALSHDWVAVPKSQYGEQLWDKNSVQKNQDSDWKDPNGDKLILGIIDQVCTFGN